MNLLFLQMRIILVCLQIPCSEIKGRFEGLLFTAKYSLFASYSQINIYVIGNGIPAMERVRAARGAFTVASREVDECSEGLMFISISQGCKLLSTVKSLDCYFCK